MFLVTFAGKKGDAILHPVTLEAEISRIPGWFIPVIKIGAETVIAIFRHQESLEGAPFPPLDIPSHQFGDNGQRQLLGNILQIVSHPKGMGVHDKTLTSHLEKFAKLLAILKQGMNPERIGKGHNNQFFQLKVVNIFHPLPLGPHGGERSSHGHRQ